MEIQATKIFTANNESKKPIVVNQGGSGSSKTFSILQVLLLRGLVGNGLRISVVSESFPHLKRGAMADFFNILKLADLYNPDNHNRTDSSYQLNNSFIEFFSADSPEKAHGARRDILFINEANHVNYDIAYQLMMRTKGQTFIDFNPTSSCWIHENILTRPDADYIHSTYLDNPFLSANERRMLEMRAEKDDNFKRVYLLGEVGTADGLIFPKFQLIDTMPEGERVIGLDFGFTNDPTAIIEVVRKGDNLYFNELLYRNGMLNNEIAKSLKRGVEVFADSAEPKSIEEIFRLGYNIKPCTKGKDSIETGIGKIKQFNLFVTKDSVNLIKELRAYSWAKDKNGKALNEPIDYYNHACDAIRYAVMGKWFAPPTTYKPHVQKMW